MATVRISGDQVGRFGLAHRCRARDVATTDGAALVATDEDVLVGPDPFESLAFGPAVAVTADAAGTVVAADETGRVSRYDDGEWTELGAVEEVRALSAGLVAAADGVFRIDGDGLASVGLDDARDVASADGVPLAATGDGLYRLGNGWLRESEGSYTVVAAGDGKSHAATAEALYARGADGWEAVDLPAEGSVVDVAYGECVYAATESGTVLVEADPELTADGTGGWRSRSIGLPEVSALAVA
ncbi:hypothetical protein ACFQL4_23370 [Halosimplex aquaticum]